VAADDKDAQLSFINKAGTSNRIWKELYKVIDSSDVLLQVLDARDPMGTRCLAVEKYLRTEKKFKHVIFILNKADLIPPWATKRWVAILSKEYPTVAFHAHVEKPFGKGNVISLIRQFARLQKQNNKKLLSVGMIGYPNVGKSSVINTLRGQKVCNVAPIPGETKVWQYVALSKRIYLIDCPGVIHHNDCNDETGSALKSVIRIERLGDANKADHVKRVLELVDRQKMMDTYRVPPWKDHHEFLANLARQRGKLRPGGAPDVDAASRMVLYDWQRARIPWFVAPPRDENNSDTEGESDAEGGEGTRRARAASRVAAAAKKGKKEEKESDAEESMDEASSEEEESGDMDE
jgi:nuclear GTP-binding protein